MKIEKIIIKGGCFQKSNYDGTWWKVFNDDRPNVLLDQRNLPKIILQRK